MRQFTAIIFCCSKPLTLSSIIRRAARLAGSSFRWGIFLIFLTVNFSISFAQSIPNPFPENEIAILPPLPNGVRLILKENHAQPIVAMEVVVRSGSAEDEGASGVAHYLEHVCFQGSANYPKALSAQYALEMAGVMSNAFTNRDATRFQAQAASDKAELMINILSDIVLRPTLSDVDCLKERALIEEEIAHLYDNPVAMLIDGAYAATYPSFTYKNPALGLPESLPNITADALRQFHKRWYVAGNISVVLAGDITKERASELVRKAFGGAKATKPPALPKFFESQTVGEPVTQNIQRNLTDTWQMMAFSIPAADDISSLVALQMIKTLLTGGPEALLPAQWMKDGIKADKYGVELLPSRFPGRLLIWAETSPEMAKKLQVSTIKLFNRLAVTPMEPDIFAMVKQRLLSQFFLSNETFTQQAGTLAAYEGMGGAIYACHLVPILHKLSADQVCRAMPVQCLAWITLGRPPKGSD